MPPFSNINPLIIDCCGDSTVEGWTNAGTKATPDPSIAQTDGSVVAVPGPAGLQALLQGRYGGMVQVRNLGRSGTTATNWRDGTAGVAAPWAEYLANTPATIIVMGLGINDQPDELTAVYPILAAQAGLAGKRFVIQTPNAIDLPANGLGAKVGFEQQLGVASDLSIIDLYGATAPMPNWSADLSYGMLGTAWAGIHPNQAGYTVMAAVMDLELDPIVADLLGAPRGRVTAATPLAGTLLIGWPTGGLTDVNILPASGAGYWDGGPARLGTNYAIGSGLNSRAIFSLPAGQYRVELAGFFQGKWLTLDVLPVTVP